MAQASFFGGLPVDDNSMIVTQALQGDANLDGAVNLKDFNIWLAHVGVPSYSAAAGDLNGDGAINLKDFNLWLAHVGNSTTSVGLPAGASGGSLGGGGGLGGTSPVPEPATMLPLGLGAIALLRRRRRHEAGR